MLILAAAIDQAGPDASGEKIKQALESLAKPVEGVIAVYNKPFSAEDHEATEPAHVVFGEVKSGQVVFANESDKGKVGR